MDTPYSDIRFSRPPWIRELSERYKVHFELMSRQMANGKFTFAIVMVSENDFPQIVTEGTVFSLRHSIESEHFKLMFEQLVVRKRIDAAFRDSVYATR